MGDRVAKSELFEQFARVAKALAAPRRLELLDLLAQGERSVDALARAAGIGVSTTSMHLQSLRQAGLVRTRKEGTSVHYRLAGTTWPGCTPRCATWRSRTWAMRIAPGSPSSAAMTPPRRSPFPARSC